jgi:hypothetical protein
MPGDSRFERPNDERKRPRIARCDTINCNNRDRNEVSCYGSPVLIVLDVPVPHCPIRQLLASFAAAWVSVGSALADELLRPDIKYDHDHEITVCLSSDDAKSFYQTPEGADVVWTGCFPAKLGGFLPRYRVASIQMTTQRGVFGFVYGISESVTPRTGAILYNVPIYIVTSAVVIDRNQREVLLADLK